MRQSEAARIVGILNGYFPTRPLPEETVALWAGELLAFEYDDALAAARAVGTNARFLPALAEFLNEVREAKKQREFENRPALPQGEEHFVDFATWRESIATPAQRQTLARFIEGLRYRGVREEGPA